MFDEKMRLVKDHAFNPLAQLFQVVPPWFFTLAGLVAGVATAVAVWQQQYLLGLVLWLLNRVFDGLDGAVARQRGASSDISGYLDIVVDFVI